MHVMDSCTCPSHPPFQRLQGIPGFAGMVIARWDEQMPRAFQVVFVSLPAANRADRQAILQTAGMEDNSRREPRNSVQCNSTNAPSRSRSFASPGSPVRGRKV